MLSKPCSGLGKIKGVLVLSDQQLVQLRIRSRDYDLVIGLDPGDQTGFALWSRYTKKLEEVRTLKIHKAQDAVRMLYQRANRSRILVRMEDARLRQYLPKEKNNAEYRGKLMGAGSIKRDCTIWEDFLKDERVDLDPVAPAAHKTKWTAEYFVTVTGWSGRTSEHARDAAVLVFGF
jgi:hypothetical protein